MTRKPDETGGAEVVAAILLAPVAVAFVVLVFFLGRQVDSRATVRAAADSAAQAAARQRTPQQAETSAQRTVTEMLASNPSCATGPKLSIDLSDFKPGGIVTVDISCTTRTSDLTGLGPGAKTLVGHGTAIVDTFKATTP
jgi:Flp pilus assembly protein TadG